MAHGAPMYAENAQKLTACDCAELSHHSALAQLLESRMVFAVRSSAYIMTWLFPHLPEPEPEPEPEPDSNSGVGNSGVETTPELAIGNLHVELAICTCTRRAEGGRRADAVRLEPRRAARAEQQQQCGRRVERARAQRRARLRANADTERRARRRRGRRGGRGGGTRRVFNSRLSFSSLSIVCLQINISCTSTGIAYQFSFA